MDKKELQIGLFGVGGKMKFNNGFLEFKHPYGKTFRILVADIDTVTIDVGGFGKGILKIIGHGTELARAEMPISWVNKCQTWILENK